MDLVPAYVGGKSNCRVDVKRVNKGDGRIPSELLCEIAVKKRTAHTYTYILTYGHGPSSYSTCKYRRFLNAAEVSNLALALGGWDPKLQMYR